MILTAPYTFQYAGDIFMKKMYGVTTPVVTPFTADNAVDTAALRQLTDFLISRGVHGLYPNGSTGEMNKMSVEERMLVAETVQDQAAGRIPVFVQVGAQTTADTLKLAKHAVQIGAAGIGVLTPQYMGVTDDELVYYYTTVSASIPDDFPVYLYNIPQCSGNDITPAVVDRILRETKNVVGIKYSFSDMERFRQYLQCGDGNFDVIVGPDRLMLVGLMMGCKGTVAGCSQCDPTPFVNCYQAFLEGNMSAAQQASAEINELCDIVKAGSNIAYTKAALESEGLGRTHVRAPALDLDDAHRDVLLTQLKDYRRKYSRV